MGGNTEQHRQAAKHTAQASNSAKQFVRNHLLSRINLNVFHKQNVHGRD